MKVRSITIEDILYLFIFCGGLILRLINLGSISLNNYEASLALQALSIARGAPLVSGSQPFYVQGTALLFYFFGSNEFLARLLPALVGSLVVLPLYLLREKIGKAAALCLGLFLIIDPAFLASSRQADSLGISAVFIILFFTFLVIKKPVGLGISLGLVVLSGVQIWLGLLGIGITFLLAKLFLFTEKGNSFSEHQADIVQFIKLEKYKIIGPALFTAFLGGSLFFIFPAGLSSTFSSPILFIQSWSTPVENPIFILSEKLMGLLVYEPLVLFLGLFGTFWVIVRKDKAGLFLVFWWITSLILGLVYPAGKINDLIWMVIPLWAISARFLVDIYSQVQEEEKKWFIIFIGLSTVVMVFLCMALVSLINFNSIISANLDQNETIKRGAILFGGLILLLSTTYLVGFGWSTRLAFSQWVYGLSVVLFVITFSGGWSAAGLNNNPETEMWRLGPYPTGGKLLEKTIDDYSRWNLGAAKLMDVSAVGVDAPFIRWLLRDQRDVKFETAQPTLAAGETTPSLLITQVDTKPNAESAYRGSAFVIGQAPDWSLMSYQEWVNWFVYRGKVPLSRQTIILWIKNELFPGGGTISEDITTTTGAPAANQANP